MRQQLEQALYTRRRTYVGSRRRRSFAARLADNGRCLLERLNTSFSRVACKMLMGFAMVAVGCLILCNALQRSYAEEGRQTLATQQKLQDEYTKARGELNMIIRQNKDSLGLDEGKPDQLIKMN
jgi:hypothetical protein